MPLAEARAQLSKLVDDAVRMHECVEVTKNGRRAGVIMGADDYDSLMETLDILSDADTMAEIRRAEVDIAEGRTSTLGEASHCGGPRSASSSLVDRKSLCKADLKSLFCQCWL